MAIFASLEWYAEVSQTINQIYREELDRSRFDGTYVALQRDFLRAKYANRKIDAFFVDGASASISTSESSDAIDGVRRLTA